MTSHNINKIVRSNIKNPWLLSKNTTEIVNSCISKIYKSSPNNFKYELMPTKMATVRPENKAPVRSLKSQERVRQPAITTTVTAPRRNRVPAHVTAGGDRLLGAVMHNNPNKRSAVANVAMNKKLLKTPTYRIYGQRRFGSSASSSQGSYMRRHEDRRRQRNSSVASQSNYLLRSFGTQPGTNINFGLNAAVAKYLVPVRNQHIESRLGSVPHAIKLSSAIQRDLMPIERVRDTIAMGRHRGARFSPRKHDADPMEGWHHPPPHDLFMTGDNERGLADGELLAQYRRLKSVTENRHSENLHKMEKTSQLLGPGGTRNAARQRLSDSYSSTAREVSRIDKATYNQRIEAELARRRALRKSIVGGNTVPTAASVVLGSSAPQTPSIQTSAKRHSRTSQQHQTARSMGYDQAQAEPAQPQQPPPEAVAQPQKAQSQHSRPQLAHKQQPYQPAPKQMKPKSSYASLKKQKKSPASQASVKSSSSKGRAKQTRGLEAKVSSSDALKSTSSHKKVHAQSHVQHSKSETKAPIQAEARAHGSSKTHGSVSQKNVRAHAQIQETASATMAGTGNGTSLNVNSTSRFSRAAYYPKRF